MDYTEENLKTNNLNIRTATDLARDRTKWRTRVQTHRQPIWMEGREKKRGEKRRYETQ